MKLERLWTPVWRFLLLTSFSGVCLALATVILKPAATQATPETFSFPPQIALSGWQFVEGESIEGEGPRQQGQRYRYVQNDSSLEIELWYGRNGNACQRLFRRDLSEPEPSVQNNQAQNTQVQSSQVQSTQPESAQTQNPSVYETADGLYEYISQPGANYLRAMIDSRGSSVVTPDQFIQNRYRYFLRPQPVLRWLTGKETIAGDHDCLSAELSQPVEPASTADSRPLLELAWQDLSRWGHEQLNSKS